MKKWLLIFIISGCSSLIIDRTHRNDLEYFYYSDADIFHVSYNGRVTKLSWSDIQVLGIDSLRTYYLEQNAER